MQTLVGQRLYSATDLIRFLDCRHHTHLDLRDLESPLQKSDDSAEAALLQDKGVEHEAAYLAHLRDEGIPVVEIARDKPLSERFADTHAAIASGAPIIYQAALLEAPWFGYADILRRVSRPSRLGSSSYQLGSGSYEVVDLKLSRTATVAHLIQLCVYSDLLAGLQGLPPHAMHLVLGDGREVSYRVVDFFYYYQSVRKDFESFCQNGPERSYPEPCSYCEMCQWQDLCAMQWDQDDDLCLVAGIQRRQIRKLKETGISTVRDLAEVTDSQVLAGISKPSLDRLRHQASLQSRKRQTGACHFEYLPMEEGRGFARLPKPHRGDLFFDIEGDPLYPDGLEYLFGVYSLDGEEPRFRAFWGHTHDEERQAFEALMDFFARHFDAHAEAHLYHYAGYEPAALKRLASRHGTREALLDDLLRQHRFVDLYRVVREAIRISEPGYSLKHLEAFYREKRGESITMASQSIVTYERWRRTGEPSCLEELEAYNKVDCESTKGLHDWLLSLRPPECPWKPRPGTEGVVDVSEEVHAAEAQRREYERRLLTDPPAHERDMREVIAHLLDFHRREAKPQWWAMFDRREDEEEELLEDPECLAGLEADPQRSPVIESRSYIVTYRFPAQEVKFNVGDHCLIASTLERAGEIVDLDIDHGLVRLKRGKRYGLLPERLSVIPEGPLKTKVLRDALYRFADAVLAEEPRFRALRDFLTRTPPRLAEALEAGPLDFDESDPVPGAKEAVARLDDSILFIQGPPGTGKTYTASHMILHLISAGHKVGVTSNSHKAINQLLSAVEQRAREQGVKFRGVKKSREGQGETFLNGAFIADVTENAEIDPTSADLIAGTAWLFAREEFDQTLDILFVDEAGQVSLANLVAMGTSARNIVLVGDQMQLGQPIQGVHPGDSGLSTLDFLLRDQATIPPDRGIFLAKTWRLHPDVCGFISDAVYDGRLVPEAANHHQRLVLGPHAHEALAPTGIRFIQAEHEGCSQRSAAEGTVIQAIFESLLNQRYRDRNGQEQNMRLDNILVVAPYNMQVNYLKRILPEGARVGTVDKFQGQEAEVVLISMTTSSGEELPRNIEFLYSRNRLNVAISRARCLAILVANPRLLNVKCQTIEQMKLVNTLCWARDYAGRL